MTAADAMRRFLQLPLAGVVGVLVVWALGREALAAPGHLSGLVLDVTTSTPLPGASVYLPIRGRGVVADDNGRFHIDSLSPGFYSLEVSVVGYVRWRQDDVRISARDTTILQIKLTPTVLPLGEEIVVIGKRSIIEVGTPSTSRTLSRRDLISETGGLLDVVARQPGITQVDREIHIRGARTYETDYLLDGVIVTDPFLRQGMGVRLPPAAVERVDVITGGVRASIGGASGGIVSVETLEPSPTLSGHLRYVTDALSPMREGDWNSDQLEIAASGPLSSIGFPAISSDAQFQPGFVSVFSGSLSDTHLGSGQPNSSVWGGTRWSPRSDNRYHGLLKLGWRINPTHSVSMLFTGDNTIDQDQSALDTKLRTATYSYGWPFAYSRMLGNANTFTRQSNAQILRWDLRPGNTTDLTLTFSRVFTRLHSDVNGQSPSEYAPPQDTGPVIIEPSPDLSYFIVHAGDGFYDLGDGDLWHDHFNETYMLRGDFGVAPNINWHLDAGLEAQPQTLQVIDIFRPWLGLGGLNTDHYRVHPFNSAGWIQTHANIYGTILDIGLRGEAWWPGQYLEDLIADTTLPNITSRMREKFIEGTIDLFGGRSRAWLSPRIGIAHTLGPAMSLFASYDHFARRPNPRFVYAKLTSRSPATYQLLGNPALAPERTVAIEGGIRWLRNPNWGITASVYQRDVHDYIAAIAVIPHPDRPEDFWYAYANRDLAQSRGLELTLDGRHASTFHLSAMLAVARVRGEHSLADDIFRGRVSREGGTLLQEVALDWDKPWRTALALDWTFGPDDNPHILGRGLGGNWDFGFAIHTESGKRYTPYADSLDADGDPVYYRNGEPNSGIGPYWQSLDLSLAKYFSIGTTRLSLHVDATNILNHRNVNLINPLTGDVYREGDPIPTGDNFFETPASGFNLPIWNDPARFESPVHWQFGVRWSW